MLRLCIVMRLGAAAFVAAHALPVRAERIVVSPGSGNLQDVMDHAAEGDVIALQAGEHRDSITIARKLTLEGEPGAALVGSGRGNVVTVSAPFAVVRGLTIRGSGSDLAKMDAGVFLEKTATKAVVEGNKIEGNLYGVYIHGAEEAVVQRNDIVGIREGRVNEAGNGISVWNAPGAKVLNNDIRFGRDGIFSIASRKNVFSGNRFSDVRFAVHYMYTNDGEVADNVSVGNTVGYALMFSNRLKVHGNISDDDRDHGFLFNYANGSTIEGNIVRGRQQPTARWMSSGTRWNEAREHGLTDAASPGSKRAAIYQNGPEKCVFIYNANQNRFRDNWFEGCEIGIHFTAGSEGNEITGNAFVNNRNQVKYVGTRYLDWSKNGRGNYWSDNSAFDLDGDGIADAPYRPNDIIDKVLWTAPAAKVLMNSPAVQVIRWAQAQFPALLPGGVVDSYPLMKPSARSLPADIPRP
jgi:nitrous oxidase accessory protein